MGIRKFKPTSPGSRFRSVSGFEEITKKKPEKRLTKSKKRSSGRNSKGRITMRRRGGGTKRKVRVVDFKRDNDGVTGRVASIEYDPNRSARIALVVYADGDKRYIIAPGGLKVGETVKSGTGAELKRGNVFKLREVPVGSIIHNLELKQGKGAQVARSAGTSVILMAKEGDYAHVRMPSSEIRLVHLNCRAALGEVGNPEHANIVLGKAGATRHRGRRPKVRGVAMNPNDHPHGGGEGKSKGGNHPTSPWGWQTKGRRTRKKKASDRLIVSRRRTRRKR
jgi:large subunit ribosomal protein L2